MEEPGKLIALDEYFVHQIADPFTTVESADINWAERTWHSVFNTHGTHVINFGLGRYHNRGVLDGFGGIARGREQWTVRVSRELRDDPLLMVAEPLRCEVIEPLHKVRWVLEPNSVQPIAFDLTLTSLMPAFLEDRQRQREPDGFRMTSVSSRYHQHGEVSGWMEIEGERIDIKPEDWRCFRDHSWGVRLDVGQPMSDVRPAGPPVAAGAGRINSTFLWTRALLTNPQGERVVYHLQYQAKNDRITYLTAYRYHQDGCRERIARIRHELRFDDAKRRIQGGRIHLDMLEGGTRTIEIESLGETGFHLGTGLYFGFDGKKMGSWRGKHDIEGEKIEDTSDIATLHRVHQFRDTPIRVTEGEWKGYGGFSSIVHGEQPELGLTKETSFL